MNCAHKKSPIKITGETYLACEITLTFANAKKQVVSVRKDLWREVIPGYNMDENEGSEKVEASVWCLDSAC